MSYRPKFGTETVVKRHIGVLKVDEETQNKRTRGFTLPRHGRFGGGLRKQDTTSSGKNGGSRKRQSRVRREGFVCGERGLRTSATIVHLLSIRRRGKGGVPEGMKKERVRVVS